jgi:hypothetical protein
MVHAGTVLENSSIDNAIGNYVDSYPLLGFIIDTPLDADRLKSSLELVFRHFPVLSARMCQNGKELMILDKIEGDLFSWTFEDHMEPIATVYTPLPQTESISISRSNPRERADFFIPLDSTVIRRPFVADERSPLVQFRVQRFSDKTALAVTFNHLLMDGAGVTIMLTSLSKVLKGEPLPEAAGYNDPFQAFYQPIATPPPGAVVGRFLGRAQWIFDTIWDIALYGFPEPRLIFIPNSVIQEWKSASKDEVSTNDLITAWLLKGCASTVTSGTISVSLIMDLRKHLPDIVPETYIRNATSPRIAPRPLKVQHINKMSQLEVARVVRSFVKYFTPEVEINYQSYEFIQGGKEFRMTQEGTMGLALSSWARFNFHEMDFGGKVAAFEGCARSQFEMGNIGNAWMEDGGTRICFWLNKGKWDKGLWKDIARSE